MRKLIILALLVITCAAQATDLPRATRIKKWTDPNGIKVSIQGGDYGIYNTTLADTLASQDTIFVVFPVYYPDRYAKVGQTLDIPFVENLNPYFNFKWQSGGVHDTVSVTVTYWQSLTGNITFTTGKGSDWFPVTYGTTSNAPVGNLSGVTQSLRLNTKSNSTNTLDPYSVFEYDFARQLVWFNARFVGIRIIAGTKSGFKGIPVITLRNNRR